MATSIKFILQPDGTYTKEVRDEYYTLVSRKVKINKELADKVLDTPWPEGMPLPQFEECIEYDTGEYSPIQEVQCKTIRDVLETDASHAEMIALWLREDLPFIQAIRQVIPFKQPFA